MRTAIVYDYVPSLEGGAERVLVDLVTKYAPQIDVYFGFIVDSNFSRSYLARIRALIGPEHVHTGPKITVFKSILFRICNYLLPSIQHSWNLTSYDLVISFTAFLAHSIVPPAKGKHIIYMNTPARFLWNLAHSHSLLKQMTSIFLITDAMRFRSQLYDLDAITHNSRIIAISKATQARIKSFYNKDSSVVYPGAVSTQLLKTNYNHDALSKELGTYFAHVSRIESYKNIDLLVDAAAQGKLTELTIIMGDGPYLKTLIAKAKKEKLPESTFVINSLGINCRKFGPLCFTGYIPEKEKLQILANAAASFSLNDEDFGITKIESLAVGTPLIAYAAGATPEIIVDGVNGVLFPTNSTESLAVAIRRHYAQNYSEQKIKESATPFTQERFHHNFELSTHA